MQRQPAAGAGTVSKLLAPTLDSAVSCLLLLGLLVPAVLLPWCILQAGEAVLLQDRLSIPVLQDGLQMQEGAELRR